MMFENYFYFDDFEDNEMADFFDLKREIEWVKEDFYSKIERVIKMKIKIITTKQQTTITIIAILSLSLLAFAELQGQQQKKVWNSQTPGQILTNWI
jgi:hypothetical protein